MDWMLEHSAKKAGNNTIDKCDKCGKLTTYLIISKENGEIKSKVCSDCYLVGNNQKNGDNKELNGGNE